MKNAIIIIIAILIILVLILKYIVSNIEYDFSVKHFDFNDILKGRLGLKLDVNINNKNPFPIKVGKIYLELYYNGNLIAKTPSVVGENSLKAREKTTIKDFYLDIFLDKNSAQVTKLYFMKKPIDFKIKIKLIVFGLPLRFKTNFTYNDYK